MKFKALHDKCNLYLASSAQRRRDAREILEASPGMTGATDQEVKRVVAVLGAVLREVGLHD